MTSMTSMQRVLTALSHKEPDRVPLFLLLTMHGAKVLGLSLKDYFSKAENVVEGQLRLRTLYGHDCLYNLFYAPIEVEAWGGEVIFRDDGPPNSGAPFIKSAEQISSLEPPNVEDNPRLREVLKATQQLKERVGDSVPIIGVAISPFSLPVMQMGFGPYLDLITEQRELFWALMRVNEVFTTRWANAQLAAGATAICYFDPVSSPSMIPPELYRETGLQVAKRVIAQIKGPTATHLASGRALPIIDDVATTGTAVVGVSAEEDLGELKAACRGRLTMLGNLNGIEMCRWSAAEAEEKVKAAIAQAGPGGGFLLGENHGEVPFQVSDETLLAISEAVRAHGRYPLGSPPEDV